MEEHLKFATGWPRDQNADTIWRKSVCISSLVRQPLVGKSGQKFPSWHSQRLAQPPAVAEILHLHRIAFLLESRRKGGDENGNTTMEHID